MRLGLDAQRVDIRPSIVLLPSFADSIRLMAHIERVCRLSPFRHMTVPGGKTMRVAMTNCGPLGWTSDATGYRYRPNDPLTDRPWPALPAAFRLLADRAAQHAGFASFTPDACLINQYRDRARLGLHRDSDEHDLSHPIVSVSLGATTRFMFGGLRRTDPKTPLLLHDGDVLVWGGPARLVYHAAGSPHKGTGPAGDGVRYNLTMRRAG